MSPMAWASCDGDRRLSHQVIFYQDGTTMIARFFLIARRAFSAKRSGAQEELANVQIMT